jgi:hypothetical protein
MTRPVRLSRTAELASLGPFFAAEGHSAGSAGAGPAGASGTSGPSGAWRSMGELADGGSALSDRVSAVRRYLAAAGGGREAEAVELRVAASVAHLGLVARVLSPALALAVLRDEVTAGLRLADLRWQPVLGGPFPLSWPDPTVEPRGTPPGGLGSRPGGSPEARSVGPLADALVRHFLAGPVRELADAFTPFKVSPHILWGNTASALNGAAALLAGARPPEADRVRSLAALLLDRPPLRGSSTGSGTGTRTGSRTAAGAAPAGASAAGSAGPFRRRSCCLIYRAAPGGAGALCGDCVLAPA